MTSQMDHQQHILRGWLRRVDHKPIKLAQFLCAIYIIIISFSPPPVGLRNPVTNTIIDASPENTEAGFLYINGSYRPVIASNGWQYFCLAISRLTAFSSYPVLVAVFFSKCKATLNLIHHTPMSITFPYLSTDAHSLHAYAGSYLFYAGTLHTFFHLLRWGSQGNISLLITHRTGLSGLVAYLVLPMIALLMLYFKKIKFEIRFRLHYLFFIFGIALCFHVPPSGMSSGSGFIAVVMGITLCWYALDALYICCFLTEKINTPIFQVLKSGVQITFKVSDRFQKTLDQGGFVYICLPWISNEWHAFSLFEFPYDSNKRQIFLQNLGDWTNKVHEALKRDTHRPMWVQGPFSSAFHHAVNYDHQVLVATGIGITPILSTVSYYNQTRGVNIIWVVREPDVLEFYLDYLNQVKHGWVLAFYTGKTPLSAMLMEYWSKSNVRIVTGRPLLHDIIPNLIYAHESGKGFRKFDMYDSHREAALGRAIKRMNSRLESENVSKETENAVLKDSYESLKMSGYQLTGLLDNISLDYVEQETDVAADDSVTTINENNETNRIHITTEKVLEALKAEDEHLKQSFLASREADSNALLFEPWAQKNSSIGTEFMEHIDETILETWVMLFCGGNKYVIKDLHDISNKYDIDLFTESFLW